jgi:hypothetical protein
MPRALLIASAACLAACLPLAAQSTVSGTLSEQRGDNLYPVPNCVVFAQSIDSGPLAGEYSGDKGQFVLAFPPTPRVTVGVDCPGYRLISVDGRRSPLATYDCSQPGPCAQANLTLEPLAVIEGHVLDPNGMPVEGVRVELRQTDAGPRARRYGATSDDRGYFRLFHLLPGDYQLVPLPRSQLAQGVEWKGDPLPIGLGPGDRLSGVQVQLRLSEGVELSGCIEGLAPGTKQVTLMFRSPDGAPGPMFSRSVELDEDGRFTLAGAQAGRFDVELLLPNHEDPSGRMTQSYLGAVDVGATGGEVNLARRQPIHLRGVLQIEWPERDDLPGFDAGLPMHLSLAREDGFRQGAEARPPDYRFDFQGLRPGRYRLLPNGPGAKAERRTGEDQWEPLVDIALEEGDTLELDLRVRFEIGRLSVLVKPPPGSEAAQAAHFVVGIRKDGAARLFPTDQNGRLALTYFPSGEYEICAWADIGLDDANQPETWREAGDAVRTFEHNEGVDMEITLTAAP